MKFDKALIIDTETTGFDRPVAIEIAHAPIPIEKMDDIWCRRFNPGKPIEFDAMAAHHIFDSELVDEPPAASFELPPNTDYLIGHNIDFDWEVIGKPKIKRICTLALARHFWPDASHKLGALAYKLLGPIYEERNDSGALRTLLKEAHGAKVDVMITFMIFDIILRELPSHIDTLEKLWDFCEMARVPSRINFGKHKGELIKDLPYSYKTWLLRQEDVDQYLRAALLGKTRVED